MVRGQFQDGRVVAHVFDKLWTDLDSIPNPKKVDLGGSWEGVVEYELKPPQEVREDAWTPGLLYRLPRAEGPFEVPGTVRVCMRAWLQHPPTETRCVVDE